MLDLIFTGHDIVQRIERFNSKRQLLQTTGDFSEAWSLLLGFVEHSALSKNNEVRFSFKLVSLDLI
jgi:C-terminal region of Mon2 protein